MRAWSWVAAGALLAAAAVSCLGRAPLQRASAQPNAVGGAPAAAGPASEAAKPAPQPSGEKKTREVILDHADRVRYDNKTKEYELTGGIVVRHEDGVLRAQKMRLNRETKKGTATGDLSFTNQQTVVTANRLEIDFDARQALFKGDVRLVTQKKKAQGEAAAAGQPAASEPVPKNDSAKGDTKAAQKDEEQQPFSEYWAERTEIRCPELVYDYRDNRAVARGGITARQKDRTGSAKEAVYTDKDELLVLSGDVKMTDERGQTFRADKVTISVAQDWLEAEGGVGSRLLIEEEEKAKGEPAKPAPAAGAKEAPPAKP